MAARHFLRRVGVWAGAQAGRGAAHRHSSALCRPCPVGYLLEQRHCYATRTVAADSYLVQVLKSEIEHELREEANKQGSLKGSAGPFELSDKAGTEEVILRRKFGNEQIAVTCIVESQGPDEDEDEEAEEEANENEDDENQDEDAQSESKSEEVLHLNVTITKGEAPMPALEFECTYMRGADEVDIEAISFLNDESTAGEKEGANEAQPYGGPEFSELDEKLQQAFHDLLKARGLSPKVATYVLDYLTVKEHREYMRWLHNVETFFSS